MPLIHGMSDEDYHAHHALSSSGARLLLPEYKGSPKKFQWEKTHRRVSRAFDLGHAVHAKVLGVGLGVITYPDEHLTPSGNVSTKAATVEWAAEQRAAGLTIVSPAELDAVNAMSDAVLTHEFAGPLLEKVTGREVSVFGEVDGVSVRARFDILGGDIGADLKTTDDATERGFTKSVAKWGYAFQEAWYRDVHVASEGADLSAFYFIAVEKTAPYEVGVFQLEPYWIELARKRVENARNIFRDCTETGVWPGYDPAPKTLLAPAWEAIEHEMESEMTF